MTDTNEAPDPILDRVPAETLAALRAKHGAKLRFHYFENIDALVLYVAANSKQWRDMKVGIMEPSTRWSAQQRYVSACTVWVEGGRPLTQFFDDYPATEDAIGELISKASGADMGAVGKKA